MHAWTCPAPSQSRLTGLIREAVVHACTGRRRCHCCLPCRGLVSEGTGRPTSAPMPLAARRAVGPGVSAAAPNYQRGRPLAAARSHAAAKVGRRTSSTPVSWTNADWSCRPPLADGRTSGLTVALATARCVFNEGVEQQEVVLRGEGTLLAPRPQGWEHGLGSRSGGIMVDLVGSGPVVRPALRRPWHGWARAWRRWPAPGY
jgi:hypothetical protein